jgi:polysaccharide lyase-like protein
MCSSGSVPVRIVLLAHLRRPPRPSSTPLTAIWALAFVAAVCQCSAADLSGRLNAPADAAIPDVAARLEVGTADTIHLDRKAEEGNDETATTTDGTILGDTACERSLASICDDFEGIPQGGAPQATTWKVMTSYSGQPSAINTVTVDDVHVARGRGALHVHTETSDPVYIETNSLRISSNTFYGRVLAYFDVDPGARTRGHWGAIVGVGKIAPGGQDIEVRIGGQFGIVVVNYSPNDALQISSSRDGFYDDGLLLPVRQWTCFEFEFAGSSNELRVWMNDAEIERLHVTDWGQFGHQPTPNWSPTYDRLRIGYQSWNADTPVDVWYDSVAVGGQRIGCSP